MAICFVPILCKQVISYSLAYHNALFIKISLISIRKNIFSYVLKTDLCYSEKISQGNLFSSLNIEIRNIIDLLRNRIYLTTTLCMVVAYSISLIYISWKLFLLLACAFVALEVLNKKKLQNGFCYRKKN